MERDPEVNPRPGGVPGGAAARAHAACPVPRIPTMSPAPRMETLTEGEQLGQWSSAPGAGVGGGEGEGPASGPSSGPGFRHVFSASPTQTRGWRVHAQWAAGRGRSGRRDPARRPAQPLGSCPAFCTLSCRPVCCSAARPASGSEEDAEAAGVWFPVPQGKAGTGRHPAAWSSSCDPWERTGIPPSG